MRIIYLCFIFLLLNNIKTIAENINSPVQIELISDHSIAKHDQIFKLGVLFKIEPGWHIYWKYPGDSGLPTQISYTAPEKIIVKDTLYPIPEIYTREGNITDYGYEKEVLLTNDIIVPGNYDKEHIDIGADIFWVVCREICIPGNAKSSITIRLSNNVRRQNSELFAKWEDKFPLNLDLKGVPFLYAVNKEHDDKNRLESVNLEIDWKSKVKDVKIFPKLDRTVSFSQSVLTHNGNTTDYKFYPKFYNKDKPDMDKLEVLISYINTDNKKMGIETVLDL